MENKGSSNSISKEVRRDKIVCTRVLYDDGTSEVFVQFEKPPGMPDLNNESASFMLRFLYRFISKWERSVFSIKKNEPGTGE